MQLNFLLDGQPIDKLTHSYIELQQSPDSGTPKQRHQRQTVLLNSLLVKLMTMPKGLLALLHEVKYSIQVNNSDRTCVRRGAQLLREVIARSSHLLGQLSTDQLQNLIDFGCSKVFVTVCGNDYISLLESITWRIDLGKQNHKEIRVNLLKVLTSTKMHIGSYRQETRLNLYRIIYKLLQIPKVTLLDMLPNVDLDKYRLINFIITSADSEKDPRNISIVFEIYISILQKFQLQQILIDKSTMFQNLQAYYPIDFVGDQDSHQQHNVDPKHIAELLDRCLCHPYFTAETYDLISNKIASPPIAKFLPTLLRYLDAHRQLFLGREGTSKLRNLFLKISEDQYLDQQMDEDLAVLNEKLMTLLFCTPDASLPLDRLSCLIEWLEGMTVKRVLNCPQNGKHSGTVITILRRIIIKSGDPKYRTILQIIRSFYFGKFIQYHGAPGSIVPKLGLIIVLVGNFTALSPNLRENLQLLVITLGSIYTESTKQIKVLILKILLQIYKSSPQMRLMVRKVNNSYIYNECLTTADQVFGKDEKIDVAHAFVIKSFVEFASIVYACQIDTIIDKLGDIFQRYEENVVYFLIRFWQAITFNIDDSVQDREKKSKRILNLLDGVIMSLLTIGQAQQLIKNLKSLNLRELTRLLVSLKWKKENQQQNQQQISSFLKLGVGLRTIIKNYLISQEQIDKQPIPLNYGQNNFFKDNFIKFILLGSENSFIFINYNQPNTQQLLSLKAKRFMQFIDPNNSNTSYIIPSPKNMAEQFDILRFSFNPQLKTSYPPTFIHYIWQRLKNRKEEAGVEAKMVDLLEHLPEAILVKDNQLILSLLADYSHIVTISKIIKKVSIADIIKFNLVPFCEGYLKQVVQYEQKRQRQKLKEEGNSQFTVERVVCLLSILAAIHQKKQAGKQQYERVLAQNKRAITKMVGVLTLHRKRPVRQCARHLLSLYQQR